MLAGGIAQCNQVTSMQRFLMQAFAVDGLQTVTDQFVIHIVYNSVFTRVVRMIRRVTLLRGVGRFVHLQKGAPDVWLVLRLQKLEKGSFEKCRFVNIYQPCT